MGIVRSVGGTLFCDVTRHVPVGLECAQAFSPDDISGLFLHMDASDEASIAKTGDNITSWADLSGNNRSLTPSTGDPKSGLNTVNGRNAVTLALSDRLNWANDTAFTNFTNSAHEKIVICVQTDPLEQGVILHSNGSGSERSNLFTNSTSVGGDPAYRYGSPSQRAQVDNWPALDTNPHMFSGYHDGVNAVATADNTVGTPLVKALTTCNEAHRVGSDQFVGYVCEILWYSKALSVSERTAIFEYAQVKWGIA